MDDRPVPGSRFASLDPLSLFETWVDPDVAVWQGSFRRDLNRAGHGDDEVRLWDSPALGEHRRRGQILGVALRSSIPHPRVDEFLVLLCQPSIVGESSIP